MPKLMLLVWAGLAGARLAVAARMAMEDLGTELQAEDSSSGAALADWGNLSSKVCPQPTENDTRQAGERVQGVVDALAEELPDWAPCGSKVFAAYNSWSAGVMQLGALYTVCSELAENYTADTRWLRPDLSARYLFGKIQDSLSRMTRPCKKFEIYGLIVGKLPDGRFIGEDIDVKYRVTGIRYIVDPEDVKLRPLHLDEVAYYITTMQCVRDYASAAVAAIGRLAKRMLGSMAEKLKNFVKSGSLSLTLSGGLSWKGFSPIKPPGVHGLTSGGRLEGTLGIVLLPLSQMGSLWVEGCVGKDTVKYSLDVAIGLALAFRNDCYSGSAASIGVAFQGGTNNYLGPVKVGAGQEISAAVSFGLPWSPNEGLPELDGISLGYGVTVQGGDGSDWNPIRDFWSGAIVACNQREVWRSDGGRCPKKQKCSA